MTLFNLCNKSYNTQPGNCQHFQRDSPELNGSLNSWNTYFGTFTTASFVNVYLENEIWGADVIKTKLLLQEWSSGYWKRIWMIPWPRQGDMITDAFVNLFKKKKWTPSPNTPVFHVMYMRYTDTFTGKNYLAVAPPIRVWGVKLETHFFKFDALWKWKRSLNQDRCKRCLRVNPFDSNYIVLIKKIYLDRLYEDENRVSGLR